MHLHSSPNQRLFFLAANQVAEPRRASAMLKFTPVKVSPEPSLLPTLRSPFVCGFC